jgi:hypothetical protein
MKDCIYLFCRFVQMVSTNTWESLSNWVHSCMACGNAHVSPSSVDKANCCRCVSPAVNSPEILRKHTLIVVLPKPRKNVASTLHFNHSIRVFFHWSVLKLEHHDHCDFRAYEQQITHFNGQTQLNQLDLAF